MSTYTPQKKSDADLLTLVQTRIDAAATAVDRTTGVVTSATSWTDQMKADWLELWQTGDTCEII